MVNTNNQMVVGLYSFPKSGNTWLRAIIASLTGIPNGPGMLQKYVTDTHYGKIMENPWNFQGTDWYFYKSHFKEPLLKHKDETVHTDKIVYIYRHPLDVFLSYLNFVSNNVSPQAGQSLGISFDKVEDLTPVQMEKLFSLYVVNATLFPQNRKFGSVFESIKSFKALQQERPSFVHVLRYEDLQDNFTAEVDKICSFLGFDAIDVATVFEEADKRTRQNGKFFWKRQKNNYENFLTPEQIARFNDVYKDEMKSIGYA